eukprot:g3544.t1 g3544   contig12:2296124-2296660(+)
MHYEETSQATKWQLTSQHELNALREHANRRARDALACDTSTSSTVDGADGATSQNGEDASAQPPPQPLQINLEAFGFSATRGERPKQIDEDDNNSPTDVPFIQETDPNYGPTLTSTSRQPPPPISSRRIPPSHILLLQNTPPNWPTRNPTPLPARCQGGSHGLTPLSKILSLQLGHDS